MCSSSCSCFHPACLAGRFSAVAGPPTPSALCGSSCSKVRPRGPCWPFIRRLPCVLKVSVLSETSSRVLMKNESASLTPNADVVWPAHWWWWERLVLGLWMLTTLVLTRSYAGNLVSLLAVRYIPQPFQTLQDIVENDHVAVIAQKHSTFEESLRVTRETQYHTQYELLGMANIIQACKMIHKCHSCLKQKYHLSFPRKSNLEYFAR